MDDAALVHRLAIEKLEAKAAELRSSWAWAKPMLDPDYGFTAEYRRFYPKRRIFPRKQPRRSCASSSAWRSSTTSPRKIGPASAAFNDQPEVAAARSNSLRQIRACPYPSSTGLANSPTSSRSTSRPI